MAALLLLEAACAWDAFPDVAPLLLLLLLLLLFSLPPAVALPLPPGATFAAPVDALGSASPCVPIAVDAALGRDGVTAADEEGAKGGAVLRSAAVPSSCAISSFRAENASSDSTAPVRAC